MGTLFWGLVLITPLSLQLFYPFWRENWESDWTRLKAFVARLGRRPGRRR